MPRVKTPHEYLDGIIDLMRDDGEIVVKDTHSKREYDAVAQAFIVCAVSVLDLNRKSELGDAFWRFKGEAGERADINVGLLVAVVLFIQDKAQDLRQDCHWNIVRTIARGEHMKTQVMDCLRSCRPRGGSVMNTQHGQFNRDICALFTRLLQPNGEMVVEDIHSGLQLDLNSQAFILCAVANMRLDPQSLSDAYWRYRGGRGPYPANRLEAIPVYIHFRWSEASRNRYMQDLRHWNAALVRANEPYMQAVVNSYLRG